MENEDDLLKQMEHTRNSLTDKLETLEDKVATTVEGATEAVQETVQTVKDTVQETVATVKDTVENTVGAVKANVDAGMHAVQDFFDVGEHVRRHPWPMLLGSVATGFCLGSLLGSSRDESRRHASNADASRFASRLHHHGNGGARDKRRESTGFLSAFAPEFNMLKELALGMVLSTARDMLVKGMPATVGQQLAQILDRITTKFGGKPTGDSDWQFSEMAQHGGVEEKPRSYEPQDAPKAVPMGRENDFGRLDRR